MGAILVEELRESRGIGLDFELLIAIFIRSGEGHEFFSSL
jgi:hypothetical protein